MTSVFSQTASPTFPSEIFHYHGIKKCNTMKTILCSAILCAHVSSEKIEAVFAGNYASKYA
jgi:hypothetical protein